MVIVKERNAAERLLGKFKWGPNFFELNREAFEMYEKCSNSNDVLQSQNELISSLEAEFQRNKNREMDLPSSCSETEETEESDVDQSSNENNPKNSGAGGFLIQIYSSILLTFLQL